MFEMAVTQRDMLDVPTLIFAAACIAGFLGVLLIMTWMMQRNMRSLAWWGSAYLIGASALALWAAPKPLFEFPQPWAEALGVIACGMFWSGVRIFHGRPLWPLAAFSGIVVWLILYWLPGVSDGPMARIAIGTVIVAVYTYFTAYELAQERRKSLYSRTVAILVPVLLAVIFLLPLGMRAFMPEFLAERWLTVLLLETIIYAVGSAFIVLLMVEDRHVHFYRTAATTDSLTRLLNRGAFLESARKLQVYQNERGLPVTLLMLDLDHFKSVNDRFGHATGDSVLRVFAKVALSSVRATDVVGRLGGEEFAAIVPEAMEDAVVIAERLRTAFEVAGMTVGDIAVGATVSIGLATSYRAQPNIDALILRADEALYKAKHGGRNRYCCAEEEPGPRPVAAKPARGWAARRQKAVEVTG